MIRADGETLDLITDEMLPPRRLRDNVGIARKTVLIPIAPGSQDHPCSCGEYIYFGIYPTTKKPHPVTLKHDLAIRPTAKTAGQGVSHIPDCPHRDFHLKKISDRRFFERRFKK